MHCDLGLLFVKLYLTQESLLKNCSIFLPLFVLNVLAYEFTYTDSRAVEIETSIIE